MTYAYAYDSTADKYAPLQIKYTLNDGAGATGASTVDFQYRRIAVYDSNNQSPGNFRRLARIVMTGPSLTDDREEHYRKTYKLEYENESLSPYAPRFRRISLCNNALTGCSTPTSFIWERKVANGVNQPFITAVANPYASSITITYKSLLDASVYVVQKTPSPQDPTVLPIGGIMLPYVRQVPPDNNYYAIKRPDMYVVSRTAQDNGIGSSVDTDYRYTNLRNHRRVLNHTLIRKGAGASVFEKMEALNQATRARSETLYSYTVAYAGFTASQKDYVCLGSGVLDFTTVCDLTRKVENQFDSKGSGQAIFPYIKTTTTTRYEMPAGI